MDVVKLTWTTTTTFKWHLEETEKKILNLTTQSVNFTQQPEL